MSKELECLKRIDTKNYLTEREHRDFYSVVEQALKRLEEIEKGKNTDIIDNYMAFKNDNAEPSEALECLNCLERLHDCGVFNYEEMEDYNTIKQALLNAQKEHNSINLLMQELDCKDFAELRKYARCGYQTFRNAKGANYDNIIIDEAQEPKQYLKWEDLEFEHTPKYIDVKMNDNKYKLVVGYNVAGKNLAILRDNKKQYFFLEYDKQFFNDLHLERVEE